MWGKKKDGGKKKMVSSAAAAPIPVTTMVARTAPGHTKAYTLEEVVDDAIQKLHRGQQIYTTSTVVVKDQLIAVIGDEDVCVGFLLAGIGESRLGQTNAFVVEENMPTEYIEAAFVRFMKRPDIAILIICENIAAKIKHLMREYSRRRQPVVVEIPDRYASYDMGEDIILGGLVENNLDSNEINAMKTKHQVLLNDSFLTLPTTSAGAGHSKS